MLELLIYRRKLRKLRTTIKRTRRAYSADMVKAPTIEEKDEVERDMALEILAYQDQIDYLQSRHLLAKAYAYNIPIPNKEHWEGRGSQRYLTTEGYNRLRSALRAEQKARWETRLVWVPLITALTGLGGVIVAVMALLSKAS
jgi:hypothetical protein